MSSDDETDSSTLSNSSSEHHVNLTAHAECNATTIIDPVHNSTADFDPLDLFHSHTVNTASVFFTRSQHNRSQEFCTRTEDSSTFHNDLFRSYQLAPEDYCLYNTKLNECIDFDSRIVFSVNNIEEPPTSLAEARLRPDADEWIASYKAEINSLQERNTWSVRRWRDIPAGRRAIRCKLVFRKKMIGDKVDKYKCRICAKGFSQVQGLDYFETWAPTVRDETIKACFTLAATLDLEIDQNDVSTAFLYPELREKIFMHMPEGMQNTDTDGNTLVLELNKCIYGLKQSANAWFDMLTSHIIAHMNFTQSSSDPCLFFQDIDGERYFLLTFVDDILIIGKDPTTIASMRSEFSTKFKMSHLGPVSWFLQMEVTRNRAARTITLSNRHKIYALLEEHGMTNCKPVSTPMVDGKARLRAFNSADLSPDADMSFQNFPYREIVGSLLHITKTRPDLQITIQQLCKYMHNHGPEHVMACKRALRYLRGTADLGLTLGGISNQPLVLRAYVDADWARDLDNRISITGYTLFLGNSCINSIAKNQDRIALSSTEAEYIALSACASKIIWTRQILADIGIPQHQPTTVYEDNRPAIDLAHNAILSDRTMHIDVKCHKIRERIKDGLIEVLQIPSHANIADAMTKPLGRIKFEEFRSQLMTTSSPHTPTQTHNRRRNPGDVTTDKHACITELTN